jgi:LmbE family N-acetylglucosaminyl deacetylase
MVISASRVKSICTSSETALVGASRKPELSQMSAVDIKRLAVRARKLSDKWSLLARGQSRRQRRNTGVSSVDANTVLKAQIFREALEAFEAQLRSLDRSSPPVAKTTRTPTKKQRSSEHRAKRAAIRKGMSAVEDLFNAQKRQKRSKPPAIVPPAKTEKAMPAAAKPVAKPAVKSAGAKTKTRPPASRDVTALVIDVARQRDAATAAKQSRVVRSGKTGRRFGHLMARGKRVQARRDSKR